MTENLASVYLITGDDSYLSSKEVDKVLIQVTELSVSEFGPEADPADVLQALETSSLFTDRRVVVLRGADESSAEMHRRLIEYLEQPNPSASLLLVSAKPLPKLAAAVRKAGRVVEVARGKRTDLFSWLRETAKAKGLQVSGDAMGALVEAVGEERMALVQALDELTLALGKGARLSPEEVRRQFHGRADAKIFGFIDAVAGRQSGMALEALHRLIRQGEAPQGLFWSLARHFRMLLIAQESDAKSLPTDMGLPSWRAGKLASQAQNFTKNELVDAYGVLAEADRKIKKSEEPEELTLERAVVAIANRKS